MNANSASAEHKTTAIAATDGRRVIRAAVVWLPGLAVALGAAVATAHGLYEVALAARVPAGIAWLYPLITDGLALVAYATTARLRGPAARYAWSVVVLAAGLSGLAQAALLGSETTMDAPTVLRYGVGAWPAVAAAVVAHLLYLLGTHTADIRTSKAGVQSAPFRSAGVQPAVTTVQPAPVDLALVQPALAEPVQPAGPTGVHPDRARPVLTTTPDDRDVRRVGAVPGARPGTGSRCPTRPSTRPPAHRLRTGRSRQRLPRHRRDRTQRPARLTVRLAQHDPH